MKFEEVLKAFNDGKKISRELWPDYMYIDNMEENYIVTFDLLEDDWFVIEDKKEK